MFTSLTTKILSLILISYYAVVESNYKIEILLTKYHCRSRNDTELITSSLYVHNGVRFDYKWVTNATFYTSAMLNGGHFGKWLPRLSWSKFSRAQYLNLFIIYWSTSVPNLVLLDKFEQ